MGFRCISCKTSNNKTRPNIAKSTFPRLWPYNKNYLLFEPFYPNYKEDTTHIPG